MNQLEEALSAWPWQPAREGVEVKLLAQAGAVSVLAQSRDRGNKERAMRRRPLKGLWKRLKEWAALELSRDALSLKLEAAQQPAPAAWRWVQIQLPSAEKKFEFALRQDKLREVRRREGRYLLQSNSTGRPPEQLGEFDLQLVNGEAAFKHLKGDGAARPIFHPELDRIEAHIFAGFRAYCVPVSLGRRLKDLAPGLTGRSVLEKMAGLQLIDGPWPTTDQREGIWTRYPQPEVDPKILGEKLRLRLPDQPPPKITAAQAQAK